METFPEKDKEHFSDMVSGGGWSAKVWIKRRSKLITIRNSNIKVLIKIWCNHDYVWRIV